MIQATSGFHLPESLPQYQGKKPESKKYMGLTRDEVSTAIGSLINRDALTAQKATILLRFMRQMAHDTSWFSKNPATALQVLRAVTIGYFTGQDLGFCQKIRHCVQKNAHLLFSASIPDIKLNLTGGGQVPHSALFLACQSAMFDGMLRGNLQESLRYRQSLAASASSELPAIKHQTTQELFTLYKDVLTKGRSANGHQLTPDKQKELVAYCDMTESLDALLIADEGLLLRNFNSLIADRVFLSMSKKNKPAQVEERLLHHVNPQNAMALYELASSKNMAHLCLSCQEILFASMNIEQALHGFRTGMLRQSQSDRPSQAVRDLSVNWFLSRLSVEALPPEEKKRGFEKALSACTAKFQSLSIKASGLSVTDILQKEIIPQLRQVSYSALRSLPSEKIDWFLRQLSADIELLDLTDCKIDDLRILSRFKALRCLKLVGVDALCDTRCFKELDRVEELDFSRCLSLASLELDRFPNITRIRLLNCPLLHESGIRGFSQCKGLQHTEVDPHLVDCMKRNIR